MSFTMNTQSFRITVVSVTVKEDITKLFTGYFRNKTFQSALVSVRSTDTFITSVISARLLCLQSLIYINFDFQRIGIMFNGIVIICKECLPLVLMTS